MAKIKIKFCPLCGGDYFQDGNKDFYHPWDTDKEKTCPIAKHELYFGQLVEIDGKVIERFNTLLTKGGEMNKKESKSDSEKIINTLKGISWLLFALGLYIVLITPFIIHMIGTK